MISKIQILKDQAVSAISVAQSSADLEQIEQEYFGRKSGKINDILKSLASLSPEEKKEVGSAANEAKKEVEAFLAQKLFALEEEKMGKLVETQWIDVTAPLAPKPKTAANRHPLSQFMLECEEVFGKLGFEVAEGFEIEDEDHNFNFLNIPADHPAREMQDTFWLKNEMEGHVLRTQTSNMQIRFMEANTPPFRIIAPGKVFRKDSDATHSPMFHQIECLMIDKNISLANLRFVLLSALREIIDPDVKLRFRLSFFPFVEPGLEVDALLKVGGEQKWLEIGGAGMVHPNVLRSCHVDPNEWNGFAFGFGIERMVMIKYGIKDLRLFFENDLRFLNQL